MSTKIMTDLSLRIDAQTAELKKELDKTNKSFKKFGQQQQANNKKMSDSFKKMGASILAAYSVKALVAFGKQTIALYDIQAKGEIKVKQAIKQTGNAAGIAAKELFSVAEQLQKVTRFGDEEILKDVTGQLLTFTNIAGTQFKRTQELVLDLATVLESDLKGTAIQLGKALNDPILGLSALGRSGIQFSEDQKVAIKALVETNRLADAQTLILDELSRQYGGQAKAAVEAGAGAFVQLGNVMEDLKERMGKNLVEALNPLAKRLTELILNTNKYSDALIDEKNELNALVYAATDANVSEETRRFTIEKIQENYPDFIKNIDTETVSNEDLTTALINVNEQYIERIKLAVLEERMNTKGSKLQKLFDKEFGYAEKLAEKKEYLQELADKGYSKEETSVLRAQIKVLEDGLVSVRQKQIEYKDEVLKSTDAWLAQKTIVEDMGLPTGSGSGGSGGSGGKGGKDPVTEKLGLIKQLQKDIADLEEKKNTASREGIGLLNDEIDLLQEKLKELQNFSMKATNISINTVNDATGNSMGSTQMPLAPIIMDKVNMPALSATIPVMKKELKSFYEWWTEEDAESNMTRANAFAAYAEVIGNAIDSIAKVFEAAKQRELSAVGDNAKKREAIEKKYAKKEKALAIMMAIINGAVGVSKAFAQGGILGYITGGLVLAGVAAQIAVINSQDMASGGIVYGETLARVGEYQGARSNPEVIAPLDKLQAILGKTGGGQVEFVIDGYVLKGMMNKMDNKISVT